MERLFNDGWEFAKLPSGSTPAQARFAGYAPVDLPHDFLIPQENALYETADGWYRRILHVPETWMNQAVILRFDGVYMDCDVLLNGALICTHHYGYTCFDADLTGKLLPGENLLQVHIRHQSPNSRWYSGAGIFRDVTLHVLPQRHIALDGTYVTTGQNGDGWTLTVRTELTGEGPSQPICHRLMDGDTPVAETTVQPSGDRAEAQFSIHAPRLWNVDTPHCYTLITACGEQEIREKVGFRRYEFTTDRGLFVNGQHVKLHGVCLHHDLGCLGSAFHVKAARRQLLAMREMGVNSLRTSHNPPARQVMDLCDELGILVVSEVLDMWQHPKTPYDYARFFDADVENDVAAWVRRDRNHPSLLMWSVGNEIGDTHNYPEQAGRVTRMLCENVRRHDPCENGATTIGSNYMPWAGAQHCAQFVDVAGYNYGEYLYEKQHAEHPEWVIYGSETASIFASRGVYHLPMGESILSDEDLQCSALGNSVSAYGAKSMHHMIVNDLNCPYSLGQYLWSGIDYIGEPTPYHTRSCYFGMMDTAVFPKDFWYLFKSLWTAGPMAHIGVHWDWNPGQMIDVPVMTNGASAELFLNGVSLGRKAVDPRDGDACRPAWRVPFAAGELRAVAYGADGSVIAEDTRRTPGEVCRIVLTAEDAVLHADGEDMTFITVSAVDANGLPVDTACDRVHVTIEGPAMLMGLDNGDSTDREGYKVTSRRLFSGKLLAVVGALNEAGTARMTVRSPGKADAVLEIPVLPAEDREGRSRRVPLCRETPLIDETPINRIELIPIGGRELNTEHPTTQFRVLRHPANAMPQELAFRITTPKGIDSPCATCSVEGDLVTVTAQGDGDILLRASASNGYPHPRVLSQQELRVTGMGRPNLDPYGFVSAGLYDTHFGDIGNGNEQGIAFARDGESMVGFSRVDFGPVGSDEITLPLFALDSDPHNLHLWDGVPGEGGRLIAVLPYCKPSIWNVYQADTYRLPERLTGLHTLCFTLTEKVHLKGFSFTRQSRAWMPQSTLAADAVYGDSFTRTEEGVTGIGNNVSLVYEHMDFGDAREATLVIDGATSLVENPITIRYLNTAGESLNTLAQFKGGERGEQSFRVETLPGLCTVSFVFLPGCRFDFYGFQFKQ